MAREDARRPAVGAIMLSTWSFGMKANDAGWPVLERACDGAAGGGAGGVSGPATLDAVEAAVRAVEADPEVDSVGYGGLPAADGDLTLDAMIMQSPQRSAGVACIRDFAHPVSIARRVMERTAHKLLVGVDAERFAEREGFERAAHSLVAPAARETWERWRANPALLADDERYRGWLPPPNVEELRGIGDGLAAHDSPGACERGHAHDTIVTLAVDGSRRMAGACSTSGMAFKVPGRVGDSPIVGHALYVDPEIGAAGCTGTGELFMGVCGAFLAVERMRSGDSPERAARVVIERIANQFDIRPEHQAGIITLESTGGAWSAAALRPGFRAALRTDRERRLVDPAFIAIGP